MLTAPRSCIPWTTAREGSRVDGTFAVTTSRPRNPTKSVNVPPTSTPTSIAGRIARDHKRLRAIGAAAHSQSAVLATVVPAVMDRASQTYRRATARRHRYPADRHHDDTTPRPSTTPPSPPQAPYP